MRSAYSIESDGVDIVRICGWKGDHVLLPYTGSGKADKTKIQIDVEPRTPEETWGFNPTITDGVVEFDTSLTGLERSTPGREPLLIRLPETGGRITLQFRK